MTQDIQVPGIQYLGDGVNDTYTFEFTADYGSDIVVIIDTVQQVEFSDYTVENLTSSGGEILFVI
ncbi:MAG: hypothetical protein DRQ89_14600, partial [Epsilonproteobacteria bacterium]